MEGKIVKRQNVSVVISLKSKGIRPFVLQGTISSSNSFVIGVDYLSAQNLYLGFDSIAAMSHHPSDKDFSISITVQPSDIDDMAHVNNVVYVRWVQDVAAAHWSFLASDAAKQKYLWVVLRHEIDYLSPAFMDDAVLATTWVGESNGPRSERFVYITNKKTGKVLVKAKTIWCLLDGTTLRPRRVDEEVIGLLKPAG